MVRVGDATSPIDPSSVSVPSTVPPPRAEHGPAQGDVLGSTCGITYEKISAFESGCWVWSFSLFWPPGASSPFSLQS